MSSLSYWCIWLMFTTSHVALLSLIISKDWFPPPLIWRLYKNLEFTSTSISVYLYTCILFVYTNVISGRIHITYVSYKHKIDPTDVFKSTGGSTSLSKHKNRYQSSQHARCYLKLRKLTLTCVTFFLPITTFQKVLKPPLKPCRTKDS